MGSPGLPLPPAGVDAVLLPRPGRGRSWSAEAGGGGGWRRRLLPKFCVLGSLATPRIRLYLKGLEPHGPASVVTYMAVYGKQEALIWQDRPGGPGVT